jgi:hypothetical protein
MRNRYKILVWKLEGRSSPRVVWEDNNKVNVEGSGPESMDCVNVRVGPVVSSYELCNEILRSMNTGHFFTE